MKLASLKESSRDGRLVVVDRALKHATETPAIASTMQRALDDWAKVRPALEEVYARLNAGDEANMFPFDPERCHAPLPRAYQWADGSAYVNHVELVRKARGAEMPERFWTDPLMYQGGSDVMLPPRASIAVADEEYGIDYEAEVAVVTDDVPQGIDAGRAETHIQLLMLVNDVSLRNLIPGELGKGFGFFHSKPPTAFSPVAVTPDELGSAWKDGQVHLPLRSYRNGTLVGSPNAGVDMTFSFPQLVAHAAHTRPLSAGTIIGSGTVSNLDRSAGSSCLAEKRMLEILADGSASTPFLRFGERVRIEMLDTDGLSIFGAIDQEVVRAPALV